MATNGDQERERAGWVRATAAAIQIYLADAYYYTNGEANNSILKLLKSEIYAIYRLLCDGIGFFLAAAIC